MDPQPRLNFVTLIWTDRDSSGQIGDMIWVWGLISIRWRDRWSENGERGYRCCRREIDKEIKSDIVHERDWKGRTTGVNAGSLANMLSKVYIIQRS